MIEAKFNNEAGNIPFRADFAKLGRVPHRTHMDAVLFAQWVTFETLDRRYVFVVGTDGVRQAHEGEKVRREMPEPEAATGDQMHHAE